MNAESLRRRIRAEIGKKDWTQAELSKRAHIEPSSLTKWMNGTVTPDVKSLQRVADALGVSVPYLLGNDEQFTIERIEKKDYLQSKELPEMHKLPVVDEKALAHAVPGSALKSRDFETVDVKYSKSNHFCIIAKGRSMYPTFSEGDRLIVERQFLTMEEYDEDRGPSDKSKWMRLHEKVVLAVVNDGDEILVKRIFIFDDKKTGFTLYLQSDNRRVPPIPIRHDSTLKIIGIVKEILRDPQNYE